MSTTRQIRAKHTILYQGEVPPHVYHVKSGLVRAYTIHENGEEATIAFFGPEDFFPIGPMFEIIPVTLFYYEAFTECTIETYLSSEVTSLLEAKPLDELSRFAKLYVGALLHVNALAQTTAFSKVIHILRYLAVRFGEKLPDGRHYKISVKLTQQDIAQLCNLSRETTSTELNKLKRNMYVAERGKHYVVDLAQLGALVGEEHTNELSLS